MHFEQPEVLLRQQKTPATSSKPELGQSNRHSQYPVNPQLRGYHVPDGQVQP
jgi:hypothetical protein